MQLAFGGLQLMPSVFWRLTLTEFSAMVDGRMAALGAVPKGSPLDRGTFEAMKRALL